MSRLFYIARDKAGKKVSGVEEASSAEELIAKLQTKDLYVVNISSSTKDVTSVLDPKGQDMESPEKLYFKPRHYRVSSDDLALLCRQLATLLGAGVTILRSLEIISRQVASRKLYYVIKDLAKSMENGLSLHESMAKHPTVFSELWVNLVESGEAGGNLSAVLSRLASYLERLASFRQKVISALIYPAILVVVGLGALLFLTIKIIPTFAELFQGFDVKMPVLTMMLIQVSKFIRASIWFMIGGLIGGIWILRRYTSKGEGRIAWERFKFKMPVFGNFFRAIIVERFTSNMATLLESGVPILYSLEITEHSVANMTFAQLMKHIRDEVREGKPMSQPLEKSGFFEPMVVQMVSIGEEVGELPQMFKKINAFYQEYIEIFLSRFTTIFEPAMLIFMGGIIAVLVIGMFLPIFQIANISG